MRTLDFSAVRTAALAILLALLPVAVNAQTPPPPTVSWLAYVTPTNDPENGPDQTAALNGLPTGVGLIGECPASTPYVRITGSWLLQDNLTIYMHNHGCIVLCDFSFTSPGAGCITQPQITARTMHDIYIDGLYLKNKNSTFQGKALKFSADYLTMTNITADGFWAFAYVRGSDQEWSGAFINSPSANGDIKAPGDGFRHFGNMATWKDTTGNKPANVWVHDFTSGGQSDGALQIAPNCSPTGIWFNDSAKDYRYENSNVKANPGSMILVGYSGAPSNNLACTTSTIEKVVISNITGSSTGPGILVYAAGLVQPPDTEHSLCSACSIRDVTIENVTIDQTNRPLLAQPESRVGGAFSVRGLDSTPVNDVTLRNITVTGTAYTCFDVSALPASGIVLDRITCDAPRLDDPDGHVANATIRATTGVTITNSTIGSKSSAALEIGPASNTGNPQTQRVNGGDYNVQNIYLDGNQFTGVASGQAGVLFRNSANGKMYRSSVTKAGGAPPTTYGAIFSQPLTPDPGAQNNEVRANNLTGVDQGVVCAPSSQNNFVRGNTPQNLTANCPP